MRHPLIIALALLATAGATTPAAAQEWMVAREQFAFAGSRLVIRVDPGPAGNLRIIRGAPGSVRVASRSGDGFTAAGLSADEELTLTSLGNGPVDYLISVPEDVRVQVRLPGRTFGEAVSGRSRSRTFHWDEVASRSPDPVPEWALSAPEPGALFTALVRTIAPTMVSVPDLAHVRTLAVRIQPGPFRAMTSRPFAVEDGSRDLVEIRPSAPPVDLVLSLPSDSRDFRLVAAGRTILDIRAGQVAALCSPVTDQRLSDGRRWVTFTPVDGALRCTDPIAPRHEG